ncbi:MAG: tetratricopeptide repeat protein [Pseudomonadota bacterium]
MKQSSEDEVISKNKKGEISIQNLLNRLTAAQVRIVLILSVALLLIIAGWAGWGAFARRADAGALVMLKQATSKREDQKIPLLKQLVEEYPDTKAGRLASVELGQSYYEKRSYDLAISAYEHVLSAMPEDEVIRPVVLLSLAHSFEMKGDYAKALQSCNQIESAGETFSGLAYITAGRINKKMGNAKGALEAYKKALAMKMEGPYKSVIEWEIGQLGGGKKPL